MRAIVLGLFLVGGAPMAVTRGETLAEAADRGHTLAGTEAPAVRRPRLRRRGEAVPDAAVGDRPHDDVPALGGGDGLAVGAEHQVAGRVGFFLRVDDFQATYQRMLGAGVTFVREPRHEPYGWVAVFLDIAGNRWDLLGG